MESKHLAGRPVPSGGGWPPLSPPVLAPVRSGSQSLPTATSGPSLPALPPPLPLRLPPPRPSVQEAEHVVCSSAVALHVPPRILLAGAKPRTAGTQVAGPLDADSRQHGRDHLLAALLDRQAVLRPQDLSRLVEAAVDACGADAMPGTDLNAFLSLLSRAPDEHGRDGTRALLDGLCRGLSLDEASAPALVEALAQALCQGAGQLDDPMDAELLMRQLAIAAGGPRMGSWMRARLVDALLDAPDLAVEQLGFMLLGLAVALEAPEGTVASSRALSLAPPDAKTATASELASMVPTLPSLSPLLAASLELSEPQLARWGQALGVALRTEGEEGLAEIGQALQDSGHLLHAGQLTVLAYGLCAGQADGCTQGATRAVFDRMEVMASGMPQAAQRAAALLGIQLARDPLGASAGRTDRVAWLQVAWQLPGVVNARTAPLWFGQALALKEPPAERARVVATLVVHGAMHLDEDAIRQARDLALSHEASAVPPIYGAWIESGLPPQLFDTGVPLPGDLRIERHLMARRLALVHEELRALPGLACDAHLRSRLRNLLTGWRTDLQWGLETAAADQKAALSGASAVR